MHEGDTFILNDPYCGGTHLPDIAVVQPVMHAGRPIALTAAMTHHQDVGGMSAGSVPTNATEIYQEGSAHPAAETARGRRRQRDAGRAVPPERAHSRYGDGRPQRPDRRLHDRRTALGRTGGALRRQPVTPRSAPSCWRGPSDDPRALARIPPGTYRYVDYLDNDGIELDTPIRIEVAVTVGNGAIEFDFAGTCDRSRADELCAVGFAGGGVLGGAGADRPRDPDQWRLLSSDHP